jgi:hypothetical protein
MKISHIRYPLAGLALLVLSTCSTTEKKPTAWYKGNLHTHTYWSDGDEFPEMVLDWYKSNGYNFVSLSDHNTVARDEKWKVVAKSKLYEDSFQNYLQKFGKDWVVYKTDTGRIQVKLKTFEEYKTKMAGDDFLIMPAEEITNQVDGVPVHINATNLRDFIPPPNGNTVVEAMQQSVDAVLKQREQTGLPMFPHINHPNFHWAITLEDMMNLKGERFFEVYNGHPQVRNYGDSVHLSTEAMWDKINVAYANKNQPLMFGLATDDSHNYHEFGAAFSNAGRGWVMVQAGSLDAASLITAMEDGKFYSSTGVTLQEMDFEQNQLAVKIAAEKDVNYTIEFIGVRRNENEPHVLKSQSGNESSFAVTDEFLFVRARVTSSKLKPNPFREGDFEMAWTQPVMVGK